jgi:hypothetical protein
MLGGFSDEMRGITALGVRAQRVGPRRRERCLGDSWLCAASDDEFPGREDEDHHRRIGGSIDDGGMLFGFVFGLVEPECDGIREWWRRNDGQWPLGVDLDSSLMAALRASGLPYIALAAADGTITGRHSDGTTAATLRSSRDSDARHRGSRG